MLSRQHDKLLRHFSLNSMNMDTLTIMKSPYHLSRSFISSIILSLCLLLPGSTPANEEERELIKVDKATGMVIDKEWKIVMANCIACHSAKTFTSYGASRDNWKSLLIWMQKTQGLWEFQPDTEKLILDYLSRNYPPRKVSRRANLPAHLRPPNPYQSDAKKEYESRKSRGVITRPE